MSQSQPRSRFNRLASLVAFAAAWAVCSQAWALPDAQFQPAFDQFLLGASGNEAAIDKSAQAFASLLQHEPSNPVLMAYAGAATAMRATTTLLPWKKMNFAEDGLAQLDKALGLLTVAHDAPLQRQVPAALEVRYVAANAFLAVPGFMNRGARGAKLLGEVVQSPLLESAPLPFKADVWLKAAALAAKDKRIDEARKFLHLVIERNAPQAAMARSQLQALAL